MSKLAEAIAAENTNRRGPQCKVGLTLSQLPKAEAQDLLDAMANGEITATAIARGLGKPPWNVKVSAEAILKHKKQSCGCTS